MVTNLSPETAHEVADFRALSAVRAEFSRRQREGLSSVHDYRALYHRIYEESIHAYARAKTVEVDGVEETEA